ncbi:MAG: AAA family ATPase [Vicinamibacterales bacterium]
MTQVAVLSADDRLVDMLRTSGLKTSVIDAADLARYARAAEAPQVLVVDLREQDQLPPGVAAFRRQHTGAGVVLVVSSLDPRLMLEAMRAGVNECVAEPLSANALDDAVRRVLTNVLPQPAGQMFAFVGAKGGVGTSTLAVNIAAVLGRDSQSTVLLIDLHIGHGDAALFLGVEPRFSVLDALENIQRVDESLFSGLVEKAASGVHLLASPSRPRPVPVEPKRARALLESAAQVYRTTVLDVPRSDMAIIDSLDYATTIVVVTSQEIASLRNAARIADTLRQRYGAGRVKVVINRFHRDAVIAQEDVERVIGSNVKRIPSDYKVAVDALNAGRPVVLDMESRLAKAFAAFAKDLAGVTKERVARPSGVLGRLAWRRA